jgi:hypothetical protein
LAEVTGGVAQFLDVRHLSSVMDINKALADFREGRLAGYSLTDLRAMSAGCVVFIQNRIPDAVHLKSAIDDEIRRKETQEAADRLLQQTTKLVEHSETLTKQTDRLVQYTVELTRFTKGVFWLTVILGVIALVQIVIMVFEYCSKAR